MVKLAVCLYGQPRTWRSTATWIKDQYRSPNVEVDYFIAVKDHNTRKQHDLTKIGDGELQELLTTYAPKSCMVDSTTKLENNSASLISVITMKQQYERTMGIKYDCVALQRFDTVTGPNIRWMDEIDLNVPLMTLYFRSMNNMFMVGEGFRNGVDDYLVMGDSFGMDAMAAAQYQAYASEEFIFNSNHTIMHRLCGENNIAMVEKTQLGSMIIRNEIPAGIDRHRYIEENWK